MFSIPLSYFLLNWQTWGIAHSGSAFHHYFGLNAYRRFQKEKRRYMVIILVNQAQEMVFGLSLLMITSLRNSTAFSRPSSGDIRLSSCSMQIAPS